MERKVGKLTMCGLPAWAAFNMTYYSTYSVSLVSALHAGEDARPLHLKALFVSSVA